jgi:hypothetical protein
VNSCSVLASLYSSQSVSEPHTSSADFTTRPAFLHYNNYNLVQRWPLPASVGITNSPLPISHELRTLDIHHRTTSLARKYLDCPVLVWHTARLSLRKPLTVKLTQQLTHWWKQMAYLILWALFWIFSDSSSSRRFYQVLDYAGREAGVGKSEGLNALGIVREKLPHNSAVSKGGGERVTREKQRRRGKGKYCYASNAVVSRKYISMSYSSILNSSGKAEESQCPGQDSNQAPHIRRYQKRYHLSQPPINIGITWKVHCHY